MAGGVVHVHGTLVFI